MHCSLLFLFPSDGSIHICAWQPDVIRCWQVSLSHSVVMQANEAQSSNGNNNEGLLPNFNNKREYLCANVPLLIGDEVT